MIVFRYYCEFSFLVFNRRRRVIATLFALVLLLFFSLFWIIRWILKPRRQHLRLLFDKPQHAETAVAFFIIAPRTRRWRRSSNGEEREGEEIFLVGYAVR
jgi:hypothetical protein